MSVHRLLALPAAIGLASATAAAEVAFNLSEVANGIYLHQGVTVPFDHPQADDVANIGFVVGQECVAVIDTGGSLEVGRALRQAIRRTTDTPICFVINTHVHPDHVLGNAAFRDDGPAFVGHANLPRAFSHNEAFFLENYGEAIEHRAASEVLIPPDSLVVDSLDLDLGKRTLRLIALRKGHTDQDLAVHDVKTGTLWLGSLFVERVPAIDGSVIGWLESTARLKTIAAVRVIPGNGPAPAPWPEAAEAQERYLEGLVLGVREILARDGFLEEALANVGQAERQRWRLFDQHHGSNVTRVYTELEWE